MSLFRLAATSRPSVSRAASSSLIRSMPSKAAGRAALQAVQSRAKYATAAKALTSTVDGSSQVGKSLAMDAEEELRKHAAAWPSWLPKPTVYAAVERRVRQEEQEKHQQDSKTVAQAEISKSESAAGEASATSSGPPGGPHLEAKKQQQQQEQQQDWSNWIRPPRPDVELPWPISSMRSLWRNDRWFVIGVALGYFGVLFLAHLESAPFTGRVRFRAAEEFIDAEGMAKTLNEIFFVKYQAKLLPKDHPYTLRANAVLGKIIAAASDLAMIESALGNRAAPYLSEVDHRPSMTDAKTDARQPFRISDQEVFVFEDTKVRAWTTSRDEICITTAMIDLMSDVQTDAMGAKIGTAAASVGTEDRLAYILAREVAHQLCGHLHEKKSQMLLFVGSFLVAGGCAPVTLLFPELTYALLYPPNSRTREYEADSVGLTLMAKACFDPREASRAVQRLHAHDTVETEKALEYAGQAGDKVRAWEGPLLSIHPYAPSRIKKLQKRLPAALEMRKRSGCPDVKTVGSFQRAATQAKQGANARKQTATLREPSSLGPGGTATASQAPAPAATVVPVAHREMPASTVPQSTPQPARQPAATATVIIEPSQPPSSSPSSLSAQ